MSVFGDLARIAPIGIWEGVLARAVEGAQCSFAVVELDPGSVVPEHRHENEQLGVVLSGAVSMRIGDETREITAGDTYVIRPDLPHEARAGAEGAIVLDVFAPAREDWKSLDREAPRPPRWP